MKSFIILNLRLIIFSSFIFTSITNASEVSTEEAAANMDLSQKDYKGAIYHYKKAIALRKHNPSDYLKLNQIYGFLKMDHESMSVLEDGVKNNPDNLDLILRLAYQNERTGQYFKAKSLYKKALEIDANNEYANNALLRASAATAFQSYTEYRMSDAINRDRSGLNSVNDEFETKSITQRFSQSLDKGFNLGIEYHSNVHKKDLSPEHTIDEENINISVSKYFNNIYTFASVGQSSYEANNVGSGTSGDDEITSGSFLAAYTTSKNVFSVSFSRDYYAEDLGTAVRMEDLEVVDVQNQYSINENTSIIAQITNGESENLDYTVYKISPHYSFEKYDGLSAYLVFQKYEIDASSNYSQQSLGLNYAKDWSAKFESNFNIEYGWQDIPDKNILLSEFTTRYIFTNMKSLILQLEASHDYGNTDIKAYGGSLALDMYF